MYGAIIGAVASVAGGVIGGIQSANAKKKADAILDKQEKRAQAQYDRDYYKDYTQTATAQNAMRKAREYADDYIKKAEGTKAVMGGTEESVAAAKSKANEMIGNTTAEIAAQGDAAKERATERYDATMRSVDNARYQNQMASAQQSAQAGGQVMQAGMNMVSQDAMAQLKYGKGSIFGLR